MILNMGFNYLIAYAAADGSFAFTLQPASFPAGFRVSVYVEPVQGIKITQTPAPNIALTGNLTGLDIGYTLSFSLLPRPVSRTAFRATLTRTPLP